MHCDTLARLCPRPPSRTYDDWPRIAVVRAPRHGCREAALLWSACVPLRPPPGSPSLLSSLSPFSLPAPAYSLVVSAVVVSAAAAGAMPTVSVARDALFDALGRTYTDEEFDELCFSYGLELDGITTEVPPTLGGRARSGAAAADGGGDAAPPPPPAEPVVMYKVEVPANRYDLLCLEGLSAALRVFIGADRAAPTYALSPDPAASTPPPLTLTVAATANAIRPYIVAAVLRGVTLTPDRYRSLIDTQDKLHATLCRRRSLVAIGTHDADTLRGPLRYAAEPPADIRFVPLAGDAELDAGEVVALYERDAQLKKYTPLLAGAPAYPVVRDATGAVLSLPPLINGDRTKVTLGTTNILIECTATDLTKAGVVLNTLVACYARWAAVPFTVEPVTIEYEAFLPPTVVAEEAEDAASREGSPHTLVTPDLSQPKVDASVAYINAAVGVTLSPEAIVDLLVRMQVSATVSPAGGGVANGDGTDDGATVSVSVPINRSDIIHACDVMEDVAIAYGFDAIPEHPLTTATVASQTPLNRLSDLLRSQVLAAAGYTEVLTWVTVSTAENTTDVRRTTPADTKRAVVIGNPKTAEFQQCRTSLLAGVLKTLRENRNAPVPLRLFELGDVVHVDADTETGAANRRRLAAVYAGVAAGFEVVAGLLDAVMGAVGATRVAGGAGAGEWDLRPETCSDEAYFDGRRADVVYGGRVVGVLGWVHPEVLTNFSLSYPASAVELDVEAFL